MLRRITSLSVTAALIAVLATLLMDAPVSAFRSGSCGAHSGKECTTTTTEACFNLIFVKWCSTIKSVNYYQLEAPGDLES